MKDFPLASRLSEKPAEKDHRADYCDSDSRNKESSVIFVASDDSKQDCDKKKIYADEYSLRRFIHCKNAFSFAA